VASGKTAVSRLFEALGVAVVDTDVLAREVVEPGQKGLDQIVAEFGTSVLDPHGRLDRKAMREKVFSRPEQRQCLEEILHPLIEARVVAALESLADEPYVLIVVPLLVESGLFGDADQVIVVDVSETVQIERLCQRDEVSEAQARQVLAAQASREQRLARADVVIDNSGVPEALPDQVQRLHQQLINMADDMAAGGQ
jgi:dephospho-CoA kinase